MNWIYRLTLFIAAIGHISSSISILRFRLPDGRVVRLDVDEEDTLQQCQRKLEEMKAVETPVVVINDTIVNFNSPKSLKSLNLTNGAILRIPATDNKEKIKTTVSKTTTATSKKLKAARLKTIAEIRAQKDSLETIVPQKMKADQLIQVLPSAERIFNRIATGGFALLIGKHEISKPTTQRRARDEIVDLQNKTTIHAVFELFVTDPKNSTISILDSIHQCSATIRSVVRIASFFGLDVVGCCIGGAQSNYNDQKREQRRKPGDPSDSSTDVWGPDHVLATGLVKRLINGTQTFPSMNSILFITLTVNKQKIPPFRRSQKTEAYDSSASRMKGLVVEGYRLSEQAVSLIDRDVIPLTSHTRKRKGQGDAGTLQLSHQVLVRHEETTSIDPLLLMVPLPIKSLKSSSLDPGVVFQHDFPTPAELDESQRTRDMAHKYLKSVIEKLVKAVDNPLKEKLRDLHLLLYLEKACSLHIQSVQAVCNAVQTSSHKLPPAVVLILQMTLQSFLTINAEESADE